MGKSSNTLKKHLSWLAIVTVAVVSAATWIYIDMSDTKKTPSSLDASPTSETNDQSRILKVKQAKLASRINVVITGRPNVNFSIAVIDLNSGQLSQFGDQSPTRAASSAKLLAATMFLRETEIGKASLSEQLGGHTALYQIGQLINQSDQRAWDLLRDRLGRPEIKAYAHELGLLSYDTDNEVISATDMARLLKMLYKEELLTKSNTQRILSFMQNTNYEQYIPPAVPDGYRVYHKVGFISNYLNDVAIIVNDEKAVALVIFTNTPGGRDFSGRALDIQAITKVVVGVHLN